MQRVLLGDEQNFKREYVEGMGSNIKSNRKKSDPSVYHEFLFHS